MLKLHTQTTGYDQSVRDALNDLRIVAVCRMYLLH